MTPKQRALRLRKEHSREYLRWVIKGMLKQEMKQEEKLHWQQVAIELGKLYKQQ